MGKGDPMNRLLPAVLAVLFVLPLSAETLIYRETAQGKTSKETATLTRSEEGGLSWQILTGKDSSSRSARNSSGAMVAVEIADKDGQWALKVEGDELRASGTYKNKPVAGSLPLKGRVWSVGFDQPLKWAVAHKMTAPLTFLMVNPVELAKPTEMVLTPDGKDTVEGKPALRFKIGLTGALAMFWSATIWADPVTGDQLQYKGNKGPGTPDVLLIIDRQS